MDDDEIPATLVLACCVSCGSVVEESDEWGNGEPCADCVARVGWRRRLSS